MIALSAFLREAMRRQETLTEEFAQHGDELSKADVALKKAQAEARALLFVTT